MSGVESYPLCRVEGCPRSTVEGQEDWCGLAKIGEQREMALCAVTMIVNQWADEGFFDDWPAL